MKLYVRFVLISPFLFLCYYLTRHLFRVDGCDGFIEYLFYIVYFFFLLVSFILSIVGITRKRESPEKVTLTITSLAALFLLLAIVFKDRIHGITWFEAVDRTPRYLSRKSVLFRQNGTLQYTLHGADYACFSSGTFLFVGDTLIIDKRLIDRIESGLSEKYLRTDSTLIPLQLSRQRDVSYDTLFITK